MISKEHIGLLYRAWKYRNTQSNEINYLLKIIKKGQTVFDIGAHKGAYSFWMKKAIGKNGKLVCFEPQHKGAELLKRLFDNKNVIVEQIALSDEKRTTQLFVKPQPGISFEASLNNTYQNALVEEVTTTTIDDYCRENSTFPSFIKIDVEGHETNVIEGAVEVFKNLKPFLLVEIEARHIGEQALQKLCNKIVNVGYAAYFFYKNEKLPLKYFNTQLHQNIENINNNKYSNNFAFEPL